MGAMLEAAEQPESGTERRSSERVTGTEPQGAAWWRSLQATATRRALLLTALGGLLIAGVTTALPAGANDAGRLVGYSNAAPSGNRASQAFEKARPGDCLNWPNK